MGEITRYAVNSVKKGYNLLRGAHVERLDRRINRLKHKNELNETLLNDIVSRVKDPKKSDPVLDRMANNALHKRQKYNTHLDKLEKARNFEENKSNLARMGLLGTVSYGTLTGITNSIPQAEIPDYVNPDGSPYYSKTASTNVAFNPPVPSSEAHNHDKRGDKTPQQSTLDSLTPEDHDEIAFMVFQHMLENPGLYPPGEIAKLKKRRIKTAGNIPKDTSKPTDASPSEAADYYDFHEYLLTEEPHPDRKDLPQLNTKEWANAPQKIAHDLGVDLYTINVIEEELGLRDRMPTKTAAKVPSLNRRATAGTHLLGTGAPTPSAPPKVGRAKPGSTLLGLAIISAAAAATNKNILERGLTHQQEDVRPSYAL